MFKVGDIVKGKYCNGYSIASINMLQGEVISVQGDWMEVVVIKHVNTCHIGKQISVINNDRRFGLVMEAKNMKVAKTDTKEVSVKKDDVKKVHVKNAFHKSMIKNVVTNGIATIVFWKDGTKTVVKCHNEVFDKEKALAMAIVKKLSGNSFEYYEVFKKWC